MLLYLLLGHISHITPTESPMYLLYQYPKPYPILNVLLSIVPISHPAFFLLLLYLLLGQITPTESPMTETTTPSGLTNVVYGGIKYGELLKTSRSRSNDKIHGPPRRRRFRLTEEALEYFQQFSQVGFKMIY